MELDDNSNSKEEKTKKPVRPQRRHRSPDPKVDGTKGTWNSFLPEQNGEQEMTAVDEIFLKFGIQFGANNDDESSSGPVSPSIATEESKLLASPQKSRSPSYHEGSIELQHAKSGIVSTISDGADSVTASPDISDRSFGMARKAEDENWKRTDSTLDQVEALIDENVNDKEQVKTIIPFFL